MGRSGMPRREGLPRPTPCPRPFPPQVAQPRQVLGQLPSDHTPGKEAPGAARLRQGFQGLQPSLGTIYWLLTQGHCLSAIQQTFLSALRLSLILA